MAVETRYEWLEPKPHKSPSRQLGIKGRNMTAWNLVAEVVVGVRSMEEVAHDFRLPVQAVEEALEYYRANRKWIDDEVEQDARSLGLR